jgi:hypothetical protein
MNYKEIKDQFLAEYVMICSQLKLTPFDFADALVYRWIDEAVSDIVRRTKLITTELSFSIDDRGSWLLPADFGGILWLKEGSRNIRLSVDGSAGYRITHNHEGKRQLTITGCNTGVFSIRYYPENEMTLRNEGNSEPSLPRGWHRAVVFFIL